MLGIAGDSVLIFLGIVLVGLLGYKLWVPVLARLVKDTKNDIDKTNRDMVD